MPTMVAPELEEAQLASTTAGHEVPNTQALIAEARARRRQRWYVGLTVTAVAAVASTISLGRGPSEGSAGRPTVGGARLIAATSCAAVASYGPLPVWARGGFHPANMPMPYVLGARRGIVAILWARHNALYSPPKSDRNNKILWVSKFPLTTAANLRITARRLVGGQPVGPVVQRMVAGGPGPSGIDMPRSGCWQFNLRWAGHQDSVDLAYSPNAH
jgi:hypothetical protein